LRIPGDPAGLASALSDLRKTETLVTADPGKAAQDNAVPITAAERILAAVGPVFDDLWKWINHLPLPL